MTEVAARHGYAEASVTRVIKRAGVSRATFYEHFANREQCFGASYAQVEAQILQTLERGQSQPPQGRARWLLTAFLAGAEHDPTAATLLTIGARAAPTALRKRRQSLQGQIESVVSQCLEELRASGEPVPQIPALALLGAVENVIAVRLQRGEAARIVPQIFDLLAWIDSYNASGQSEPEWELWGRGLSHPAPTPSPRKRLPRGRSALSASERAAEHRERILTAVASLSRSKGYAEMSVGDVVKCAEVTRAAFYREFRGKQEAFLAAQTFALQRSMALAAEAFFGAESWPERVWRGLEATLSYIASQPDLAWLDVAESFAAGPAAIARSSQNRAAFQLFLEEGYAQSSQGRAPPALYAEAISGALLELIRGRVLSGRTETALELLPACVYVALAPFLGAGEAMGFVGGRVRRSGG